MTISAQQNSNGLTWTSLWQHWKSSFTFQYIAIYFPVYAFWVCYLFFVILAWLPGSLPLPVYIGLTSEERLVFGNMHQFDVWKNFEGKDLRLFANYSAYCAGFFFILSLVFFIVFCLARKIKIAIQYLIYILMAIIFFEPVMHFFRISYMIWYRSNYGRDYFLFSLTDLFF